MISQHFADKMLLSLNVFVTSLHLFQAKPKASKRKKDFDEDDEDDDDFKEDEYDDEEEEVKPPTSKKKKSKNESEDDEYDDDGDEEDSNSSKSRNINQVNNGQDCSSKDNSCFNGMCKTTATATADATMTS